MREYIHKKKNSAHGSNRSIGRELIPFRRPLSRRALTRLLLLLPLNSRIA